MNDVIGDIVGVFLFLFVAFCIFVIGFDIITTKSIGFNKYAVIDKKYEGEKTGTGVTTMVSSGGKVGVGTVVIHESEKYILILKDVDGNVESLAVEPNVFGSLEIGDSVMCEVFCGTFGLFDRLKLKGDRHE